MSNTPSQITLNIIHKELVRLYAVRAPDVPGVKTVRVLDRAALPLLRVVPSPAACKERGVLSERLLSLRYYSVPFPIVGKVEAVSQ